MSADIKTNRLSIYLIKDEYSEHENILKKYDGLDSKEIDGLGTFYYGESHNYKPSWIEKFFNNSLDELSIFNASSKAILLIEAEVEDNVKRTFAIPFGYGWTMLEAGSWEERFGLKTVLNIIDSDNLRKINKKNLASVPKDTTEQLSRAGIAADFGIDVEQDLIQSITAGTKHKKFGKTVTGKDSLSISSKIDISNIKEFLKTCYERYISDDYKENFGWIDQIAEVKDPNLKQQLNQKLLENIKQQKLDKTWMAVPEIVKWEDVAGFSYSEDDNGNKKDDIHLLEFIETLDEDEKQNPTLDTLKNKQIFCFSSSSDELMHRWKVYNCIYCEIVNDEDEKTYLLSNGKWYEIEQDFVKQVTNDFQTLRDAEHDFNLPEYKYKNEAEYNEKVAESNNDLCCMDRQNIQYGGGHSKIEFCDLFSNDKKIIHVKHYAGSSVLSHLFAQGVVSGELFLADKNFRKKVNSKLKETHKLEDFEQRPNPSDYEIIFAVISSSSKNLDLPFFSKVSLRNAKRRLETFGYKVILKKVEVES